MVWTSTCGESGDDWFEVVKGTVFLGLAPRLFKGIDLTFSKSLYFLTFSKSAYDRP